MNVTSTTPTPAAPEKSALTGSSKMGRDEFLRLLVTQLRNQDPMNPLQGHEFAAQLAQFSTVEELLNIQESLAESAEATNMLSQSVNNGMATSLIGKMIEAEGNGIELTEGSGASLRFQLQSDAINVVVRVRDASGNTLRTFEQGTQTAGMHEINWDGLDTNGKKAPPGQYSFDIHAYDANGETVETRSFMQGRVSRVTFGADGVLLWVGRSSVPMSHVRGVVDPPPPPVKTQAEEGKTSGA